SGDCAGAVVVVRGAVINGAATIDPTCIDFGSDGERRGAALRSLETDSVTTRVAVGAPAHRAKAGAGFVYSVTVDAAANTCSLTSTAIAARELIGDRYGATFGH